MGQNQNVEWLNRVYLRAQYYSFSFILMTLNLKSPVIFADDGAIYRPICSESDSLSLQEDKFKLQKWANTWQITFNVNKCKLLRIIIASQV